MATCWLLANNPWNRIFDIIFALWGAFAYDNLNFMFPPTPLGVWTLRGEETLLKNEKTTLSHPPNDLYRRGVGGVLAPCWLLVGPLLPTTPFVGTKGASGTTTT